MTVEENTALCQENVENQLFTAYPIVRRKICDFFLSVAAPMKQNRYRIYLAIRRGFHLSRMTTNNLISSM